MNNHDQLVERVAQIIAHGEARTWSDLTELGRDHYRGTASAAISAYLSALPERELLAEALEAENKRLREALTNLLASLDRLGDYGVYVIDDGLGNSYAAARAALEHQQKGEKL